MTAELLFQHGFKSAEEVAQADEAALAEVDGIPEERIPAVLAAARSHVEQLQREAAAAAAAAAAEAAAAEPPRPKPPPRGSRRPRKPSTMSMCRRPSRWQPSRRRASRRSVRDAIADTCRCAPAWAVGWSTNSRR